MKNIALPTPGLVVVKNTPGHEIEKVEFFDYNTYKTETIQVAGVLKLFDRLIKDRILR